MASAPHGNAQGRFRARLRVRTRFGARLLTQLGALVSTRVPAKARVRLGM